jgi:hypothetical protein
MLVIENSWSQAHSPPNPAVALLKSGSIAAGLRQSPPADAKSAAATQLCMRRGNGRDRDNVVQIEKGHQHQRAQKFPSWDGQRRRLGVPQDAERLSRSSWRWLCIVACVNRIVS